MLYYSTEVAKWSNKTIFLVSGALYAVGTVEDAYLQGINIKWIRQLFEMYDGIFKTARNGVFFGFPYLFLGYYIAVKKDKITKQRYWLLFSAASIAMVSEAILLQNKFLCFRQNMMFSFVPATVSLFLAICFIPCSPAGKKAALHCRKLSMLIFGWHVIWYNVILDASETFHIAMRSDVRFWLLLSCTILMGEITIYLSEKKPLQWLKILY